jgi:hypothetical protein
MAKQEEAERRGKKCVGLNGIEVRAESEHECHARRERGDHQKCADLPRAQQQWRHQIEGQLGPQRPRLRKTLNCDIHGEGELVGCPDAPIHPEQEEADGFVERACPKKGAPRDIYDEEARTRLRPAPAYGRANGLPPLPTRETDGRAPLANDIGVYSLRRETHAYGQKGGPSVNAGRKERTARR